jgi:hypothetical protein
MALTGRRSSPSGFADYGGKYHVDRVSQQDHLTRNSLLALVIRRKVESPVSLDVTVVALTPSESLKYPTSPATIPQAPGVWIF